MVGNRLGWGIAALLAVLFALVGMEIVDTNRLTAATSLLSAASATDPLTTEVPPAAVYRPEAAGDAGEIYRAAAAEVRAGGDVDYGALLNSQDAAAIEAAPAVTKLIQAGPMVGAAIFATAPTTLVTYDTGYEELDALALAGRCLGRAALLRLAKEPDKAKGLFEAQFALGARLFTERLRYAEATTGLGLARDAAAGLREIAARAGDTRRAALLSTFDRSAAGLQTRRMDPVWNAVGAVDGGIIAQHAGDVFLLAGKDNKERLWRIEAILALGRHRFNLDRAADQLIVPRRLKELETGETDPAVLAAIKAAKELTLEQYRTIH
ncbi:MAG: hypothetical protein JWM57_1590 [Phycisphaerales bacterium]|nr:hypothetical protein [Phycisphaerales bacterium]